MVSTFSPSVVHDPDITARHIKNELVRAIDDALLRRVRKEAADHTMTFSARLRRGFIGCQTPTGPKFEADEASLLFSTYPQCLGFRLAQIDGEDAAKEPANGFVAEFLNHHQHIP